MKIAASDFDGTLYTKADGITKKDQESIRAWQAAGNKFGLATGRNFDMALEGASAFGIRLDFCVALNGAAVYDGEGKELYGVSMGNALFRRLCAHPEIAKRPYIGIMLGKRNCIQVRDFENPFAQEWIKKGAKVISEEETEQLAEVMQVCLDTESMERAARCAREVGRAFAGELSAVANRTFVDICMTGNDKGTGVARLLEQMGWQDEEICVIGDDRNDLSMIERFHGFAVARGNDAVKPAASQVFESVGDMLRARMEAEVRR